MGCVHDEATEVCSTRNFDERRKEAHEEPRVVSAEREAIRALRKELAEAKRAKRVGRT